MVNHGRLAKVITILMMAMTGGALVLIKLEGKPIKPMPFSLSRQSQLTSIHAVLGTEVGIEPDRWEHIEVSYQPNNGRLSSRYGITGDLARKYHFVISDGSAGDDGEIFASHRWTKQLTSLPVRSSELTRTIKICLIGPAGSQKSTLRQSHQLGNLISSLVKHCRIEAPINWK